MAKQGSYHWSKPLEYTRKDASQQTVTPVQGLSHGHVQNMTVQQYGSNHN